VHFGMLKGTVILFSDCWVVRTQLDHVFPL